MKPRLLNLILVQGFLILCGITALTYAALYLSDRAFWLAIIVWFLGVFNGVGVVYLGQALAIHAQ